MNSCESKGDINLHGMSQTRICQITVATSLPRHQQHYVNVKVNYMKDCGTIVMFARLNCRAYSI